MDSQEDEPPKERAPTPPPRPPSWSHPVVIETERRDAGNMSIIL